MGLRKISSGSLAVNQESTQRKLMIQFTCPKCSKELAWAYEYASVYCRVCDRWIRASQLKVINPAKADPDQDQLILFE